MFKSILFCMILLLMHSATYSQSFPLRIIVGEGPEDMVVDPSQLCVRLLVSCGTKREGRPFHGEIWEIDTATSASQILPRIGTPDSIQFRPHGMSVSKEGGEYFLYVISHDDTKDLHSILKYRILQNSLEFVTIYGSPLLNSPNALLVLENGTILVANDAGNRHSSWEKIMGMKRASVVLFRDGEWKRLLSGLGMANGMVFYQNKVYLNLTSENRIVSFQLADGKASNVHTFCKLKGPDNLKLVKDKLYVACHEKTMKLVGHIGDASKLSPTNIYSADPISGNTTLLFRDDGSRISAGSTGLQLGNKLYISQIMEAFILIVEIPKTD